MEHSYAPSGSERPLSDTEQANGNGNGNIDTVQPVTTSVVEPLGTAGEPFPGRSGGDYFLIVTFVLGLIGWVVSLVSQAIVAATISHQAVRILWFGFVIQTIVTALVLEVVIGSATYNAAYSYGTQISIFAALAAAFAVLGVDQNIYSPRAAQKATGAGWLIVAIIDVIWILFFTSPPHSPIVRLASSLSPSLKRSSSQEYGKVEKIGRSTDAFPLSPVHGSQHRASANPSQQEPQRKSGVPWGTYTPPQRATVTTMPSEARSTTHGGLREPSEGHSVSARPDSGTAPPTAGTEAPVVQPPPQTVDIQRVAKWRAEAMFDYHGSTDDPNELRFKKGEILYITDKSGKWWEGGTKDGRQGIAPSNYLRLMT